MLVADGNKHFFVLIYIYNNSVDLDLFLGADKYILFTVDDSCFNKVGTLGIYLDHNVGCFQLEASRLYYASGTYLLLIPHILRKFLFKSLNSRLINTARGKDLGELFSIHKQRLFLLLLLVYLYHIVYLIMQSLYNVQVTSVAYRALKNRIEGLLLKVGGHRRYFGIEYPLNELAVISFGILDVIERLINVRGPVIKGREHKSKLWHCHYGIRRDGSEGISRHVKSEK